MEWRREGPEEARGPPGLGLWGRKGRDRRRDTEPGRTRWREAETERDTKKDKELKESCRERLRETQR